MSAIVEKLYPLGFCSDAYTWVKTAASLSISYVLCSFCIPSISLVFLSQLGQKELNGCSLALTVYSLTGKFILVGLNFACDTLLPQYYGGNKRKMGIIVQRGTLIAVYACLLAWILMLNAVRTYSLNIFTF